MRLAAKWVRHRCHAVPGRVAPIASTRPACASEVTRPTGPAWVRPRATRSRKNASHPAWVSEVAVCTPRTSRYPSAPTPVATMTATLTTRPFSRTFITSASAATNVYGPASRGRVRNAATWASSSLAISETWDLLSPVIPKVRTSLSIRRVLTPRR